MSPAAFDACTAAAAAAACFFSATACISTHFLISALKRSWRGAKMECRMGWAGSRRSMSIAACASASSVPVLGRWMDCSSSSFRRSMMASLSRRMSANDFRCEYCDRMLTDRRKYFTACSYARSSMAFSRRPGSSKRNSRRFSRRDTPTRFSTFSLLGVSCTSMALVVSRICVMLLRRELISASMPSTLSFILRIMSVAVMNLL